MKKHLKTYVIVWAIFLILFNVIAFASPVWTGTEKSTSNFWIGYVFITLCLIGNLICASLAFRADSAQKLFYNIPLISISYTALIVSVVAGGLCMLLTNLPSWIGIIVCVIILTLFCITIARASVAAELVERVDEKVDMKTSFIRDMTAKAESLMSRAQSPGTKAACKKVYEALRYSDPMSNDELSVIEAEITEKMDELSSFIGEDDYEKAKESADEIVILAADRNKKCRTLK